MNDQIEFELELCVHEFDYLSGYIYGEDTDDAMDVLANIKFDLEEDSELRHMIANLVGETPNKPGFNEKLQTYFEDLNKREKDLEFHVLAKETSVSALLVLKMKDIFLELEALVLGANDDRD